jgi:hypothetical protein
MLVAYSFPSEVASQFVETQRNSKPLLPRHAAVGLQLFFKSGHGVHNDFLRNRSISGHAIEAWRRLHTNGMGVSRFCPPLYLKGSRLGRLLRAKFNSKSIVAACPPSG